jgi:hypothetical protein
MNKKIIVLLVACAAAAQTAAANEVGLYVGGYVGQATKEVPRGPYDELSDLIQQLAFFTPVEQRVSLDDTDTAFGLTMGYRLNRFLALEAGYMRLGTVTYKSQATGDYPFDSGFLDTTLESQTSGFMATVLGVWPVTRNWELFARAGMLFATNRLRLRFDAQGEDFIPAIGNSASDSFSKSTSDIYGGVGISRRIFEIYELRLEYHRVFDGGEEVTGGKADLDAALLGVTVTF